MNKIWIAIVITGAAVLCFYSPDGVLEAATSGVTKAFELSLKLIPVYVVWSGLLRLMEDGKLTAKITKLFRPVTKRLFKGESEQTLEYIGLNFASNMLGMTGAATPLGIKAIDLMSDNSDRATHNQTVFTVINTTSLQILPTTVIALRLAAGSVNPSDIILPSIISSALCTVLGVTLVKIFR